MNALFRRARAKKAPVRSRTNKAPFSRETSLGTVGIEHNRQGYDASGLLSCQAKWHRCQRNKALQKYEERRLSLASDGGLNRQTPGLFAFIEVWTKWREQGNSELARQLETSESAVLSLSTHPKWLAIVEAVVAEWRAMGKYDLLARAALKGFKRDGTFQEEVAQLYACNPGQDRTWYEAQAAIILTDWDTLNSSQRLVLFELMLDPDGELILRA